MKIYSVQLQRTAGAYRTVKSFQSKIEAETFMLNLTQHDPNYNTGNVHHCNRYRIIEEEVI